MVARNWQHLEVCNSSAARLPNAISCFHGSCITGSCICESKWFQHDSMRLLVANCNEFVGIYLFMLIVNGLLFMSATVKFKQCMRAILIVPSATTRVIRKLLVLSMANCTIGFWVIAISLFYSKGGINPFAYFGFLMELSLMSWIGHFLLVDTFLKPSCGLLRMKDAPDIISRFTKKYFVAGCLMTSSQFVQLCCHVGVYFDVLDISTYNNWIIIHMIILDFGLAIVIPAIFEAAGSLEKFIENNLSSDLAGAPNSDSRKKIQQLNHRIKLFKKSAVIPIGGFFIAETVSISSYILWKTVPFLVSINGILGTIIIPFLSFNIIFLVSRSEASKRGAKVGVSNHTTKQMKAGSGSTSISDCSQSVSTK